MTGKSEAYWLLDTAKRIFKKMKKGGSVYHCDVNHYLQCMLRNDVEPVDYAEWQGTDEDSPKKDKEDKKVKELSSLNTLLATKNAKMDIRISNLTTAVATMASHNQELLSHLAEMTLQNDTEHKDWRQRRVQFRGNN